MPDHPASDPAKPGSKLDTIQKLGRRGGIRTGSGRTLELAGADRAGEELGQPAAGGDDPAPRVLSEPAVKSTTRKPAKKKTVKRAKAVLKTAEKKAKAPKKPGPPSKVGQPWKKAGVSKSTFYRGQKGSKGK